MLFHTHILLGIVIFLLIKDLFHGGNEIIFFLLILLGSILPDIDERKSKINRWSGIIGVVIAFFFKHRGLFHSLILHFGIFLLIYQFFNLYYAIALFMGYLAHIFGDGLTLMGVTIFYPFSDFKIKGPVRVGGFLESIFFVAVFFLIIWQFV